MTDKEFRAFLDLMMFSDPWPVADDGKSHRILTEWANREANNHGYGDWVEAYHLLPVKRDSAHD